MSTRFEKMAALKAEKKTYREVGEAFGVSAPMAHKILKRGYSCDRHGGQPVTRPSLGRGSGPNEGTTFTVVIREEQFRRIVRRAAAKRGLTLSQLWQDVAETIVMDDMFDAILDDGVRE